VDGVLTEEVVPAPVGPYGESKIAAEKYILEHLPEDRDVYIFRPCMIHGPGNKGNLNLLYKVVKKGIPWPLGAYENRRTFTSVENICFAVNGVLTKEVPSGIYNMGDDEALSTNELIEEICQSLGKKAHIWKLPKGLMNGVAKVGGYLHLPLDSERLRKLTENYISSNAKIKAALGVEKMPVDAKDGLKVTLKSF
jgi:nucleoside-diphosphate-sugar epimerase